MMLCGMPHGVPLTLFVFSLTDKARNPVIWRLAITAALLPETCCECGNRLLDRGVVVGTLDDKTIGFFADLLD